MSPWYWILYIFILSASLVLHEVGHWAEMTRLRIPMVRMSLGLGPSIRLWGRLHLGLFPVGASVSPDPDAWRAASAYDRFRVALAGPLASFTCAFILLALSFLYPHASKGLSAFATIHFAIGAFNILPFPPLDGWTIMTEFLAANNRPLPARTIALANRLGSGMLYGLGFLFIGRVLGWY
jgi:Zn-dependent protease